MFVEHLLCAWHCPEHVCIITLSVLWARQHKCRNFIKKFRPTLSGLSRLTLYRRGRTGDWSQAIWDQNAPDAQPTSHGNLASLSPNFFRIKSNFNNTRPTYLSHKVVGRLYIFPPRTHVPAFFSHVQRSLLGPNGLWPVWGEGPGSNNIFWWPLWPELVDSDYCIHHSL